MKIVIYSDCMSIAPETIKEEAMYSSIIKNKYKEDEIIIDAHSGMTTKEAVEGLNKIIDLEPDMVILGWGVNDALPRGLKRKTRGKIIRAMYKLKFNSSARLFLRSTFLNPLEFISQFFKKPYFYVELNKTIENFEYIINKLKENNIEIIVLSINPILNYRFFKSEKYIKIYNYEIENICLKKAVPYINVFQAFVDNGIKECLSEDLFHYSKLGHEIVGNMLIEQIDKSRR